MQLAAVVACSACLDVNSTEQELYLEETLPWWRFASDVVLADLFHDAAQQCIDLAAEKLVGPGSKWLEIIDHGPLPKGPTAPDVYAGYLRAVTTSLSTLGLDLQIYAFHQGLELNWRHLLTILEKTHPDFTLPEFERLSYDSWRSSLRLAIPLMEYTDGLLFPYIDHDKIYEADHPIRRTQMFQRFELHENQLLAHLLNGASARTHYAAYAEKLVPRSGVLHSKTVVALNNSAAAGYICTLMKHLFEDGAGVGLAPCHLTVIPETVLRNRYI